MPGPCDFPGLASSSATIAHSIEGSGNMTEWVYGSGLSKSMRKISNAVHQIEES
jgi:hypothetical protein